MKIRNLSSRALFRVFIALSKHKGDLENSRQLYKPRLRLGFAQLSRILPTQCLDEAMSSRKSSLLPL